jgi:ABC-type dipeptide/oligopeptide/nickel transport system permease component
MVEMGWVLRILAKNLVLFALAGWLLLTLVFIHLATTGWALENIYTSGLPPGAREELKQQLQRTLALDRPLILRYGAFLRSVLVGEWGLSSRYYPRTVIELIGERLPRSLLLLCLALVAGIGLGHYLARLFRHPSLGVAARLITLGLATIPLTLMVLLLGHSLFLRLDWLPLGQTVDPLLWRGYPDISLNVVLSEVAVALASGALLAALISWGLCAGLKLRWGGHWGLRLGLLALGTALTLPVMLREYLPLGLDLLRHLALPWSTLTLYVGSWYALLVRGDLLGVRSGSLGAWAIFLALTLSTLLAVEGIYHWLGFGPIVFTARLRADFPLLLGLSFVLSGIFLSGILAVKMGLELRARRRAAHAAKGDRTRRRFQQVALKAGSLALLVIALLALLQLLLLHSVWDPKIYDPQHGRDPHPPPPAPPSAEHPLGTDRQGRDVLSGLTAWASSTFASTLPPAGIAALLGLMLIILIRAFEWRRWPLLPIQALTALAYAPLLLPFLVFSFTLVLVWPLPPWALDALHSLPWAFCALAGVLYASSRRVVGWRDWALGLGAAVSYGAGAGALLEMALLPRLPIWVLQDPFQQWWLFWPEMLTLWLFLFTLFTLGWALQSRLYGSLCWKERSSHIYRTQTQRSLNYRRFK